MEGTQFFQQINIQRRLARSNGNAAMLQSAAGLQFFLRKLKLFHSRSHPDIQPFSFWGQPHSPIGPDKQRTANLLLQKVDCPGDIGLSISQRPGRPGKILIFGHIIKNTVIFKIDIHNSPLVYQILMSGI